MHLFKPPSTPLHQVQHARSHGDLRRAHDFKADKREVHLIEVKYCYDTRPGRQLEASSKLHDTLQALESQKGYTPHWGSKLLGVEGPIYISNTSHHLKGLSLDLQRIHKTALKSHAHSVYYAHKLTTTKNTHLKKMLLRP